MATGTEGRIAESLEKIARELESIRQELQKMNGHQPTEKKPPPGTGRIG